MFFNDITMRGDRVMKMHDFEVLCGRYLIPPNLALENPLIVETLLDIRDAKDDNARIGYRNTLILLLETEF